MIVCASRRTDIPAFHSEWVMNRLRAGYALVRNPVCRDVVNRVDLGPRNVDMLVFMTKDPRPMIEHLDEITRMGIRFCFQVTINPYGRDIEPGISDKAEITEAFRTISEMIGRDRVVWRYDPVILNSKYDVGYHKRKFRTLCNELDGYTDRCTFGFVDIHRKLAGLAENGTIRETSPAEMHEIGRAFAETATSAGMKLNHCCADEDLSIYGITSDGCLGREMMSSLSVPFEMSAPLRERCRCVRNVDIGCYDTCDHDCAYCYANKTDGAMRRSRLYDPEGEMLYGRPGGNDRIVGLSTRKTMRISDF